MHGFTSIIGNIFGDLQQFENSQINPVDWKYSKFEKGTSKMYKIYVGTRLFFHLLHKMYYYEKLKLNKI